MKKFSGRHIILIVLAILFSNNVLFAVPAKPGLVTMRQPDGTEINVRIMGDEHAHYYLSEDGYLLVNDNETFYYGNADAAGNIVQSRIVARPVAERSAEAKAYLHGVDMEKVFAALERRDAAIGKTRQKTAPQKTRIGLFDTGFPSEGVQKGLVVLVEYKDVKFTLSDPYNYFNRMLNENGFNDYGGTGCAAEYFRECSQNKFRPQFDVYGPITLSQNMSYYGGNDYSGNDKNPHKMAIEACQQLDATVDFSEYDRDGDGYIDNVFVFYAGRGEASGGSSNTVWPHAWNVTSAEYYSTYMFDGVQLDRYACSNEWEGSRPDGVGTFIHEFSHVMGLPDLYATSYTSAFTPGAWSALDYGPYNNGGCTPPLYSAYERYSLGWMTPRVLNGPASVTLKSIGSNEACIIPTGNDYEFFLLENRQQTGWDKYIPGHGMLVWHVDYNPSVWENNTVNNQSSHQYVDIEEADGTQSESSRAGDAFPGTSRVTSFTDDTRPSMRTWSGKALNLPVTDIAETNGIITFKVAGGIVLPDPVTAVDATDIHSEGFTAHWLPSAQSATYELSVYTKIQLNGGKVIFNNVDGYNHLAVTDTFAVVSGLEPDTEYFYTVYVNDNGYISEASNEISVITGAPSFKHYAPEALEATDVEETSFTANWMPLEGAEGYEVIVYGKVLGNPYQSAVDFTGGIKAMPNGWSTNTSLTYANTAYSGEAVPALRFAVDDASLTSPVFDDDVRSVSFWHRGVSASSDNRLKVSVKGTAGGGWTDIAEIEVENAVGGVVTTISDIPAGTRAVRISYSRKGTGSVAVDDVVIEYGGELTVSDFGKFNAGNVVSTSVSGLLPATTYYYTVMAIDGVVFSRMSNEIAVTTASTNTGIDAPAAISGIRINGRRIVMSAGAGVTVSDISGRVIYRGTPSTAETSVTLPAAGVYVIKNGGRFHKVVVQ